VLPLPPVERPASNTHHVTRLFLPPSSVLVASQTRQRSRRGEACARTHDGACVGSGLGRSVRGGSVGLGAVDTAPTAARKPFAASATLIVSNPNRGSAEGAMNWQQRGDQQRAQMEEGGGGGAGDTATLKLKGLPFSATESSITQFFAGFALVGAYVLMDPDGRPSGMVRLSPCPRCASGGKIERWELRHLRWCDSGHANITTHAQYTTRHWWSRTQRTSWGATICMRSVSRPASQCSVVGSTHSYPLHCSSHRPLRLLRGVPLGDLRPAASASPSCRRAHEAEHEGCVM
jgi:hypothetical protein